MKIKRFLENGLEFDNGVILEYYHDQDCCENVYADFEILKNYNVSLVTGKIINIKDIDFEEDLYSLIKGKWDEGFNMRSKIGENFFVPCYNEQNGYYNNKLELVMINGTKITKMNISQYCKDEYR